MTRAPAGLTLAGHYLDVGRPARTLEKLDGLDDSYLLDPEPEPWFLRAGALHDLERYREAADAARAGLARDPAHLPLLAVLFSAEAALGDLSEAERAILSALELTPHDPCLLSRYALVVVRAGQVDKARRLVALAARSDPDEAEVLRARSVLAYVEGSDSESADWSRRLLAHDPEGLSGLVWSGSTAAEAGRLGQASRQLRAAAAVEPSPRVAEAARELQLATHPLMWPVRPVDVMGVGPVWLGAVAAIVALAVLAHTVAAAIAAGVWIAWVAYAWIAPPLLRRYLRWRRP